MADWAETGREMVVPDAAEKRLDEMDRLSDMLQFPPVVRAGAAVNVAVTVAATWWVAVRFLGPFVLPCWLLLVLAVNLTPVILLRLTMNAATPMPTLRSMDFVRDQHKFSDWVYLAASANMSFWVVLSWASSRTWHAGWVLGVLMAIGGLHTYWPVVLPRPGQDA